MKNPPFTSFPVKGGSLYIGSLLNSGHGKIKGVLLKQSSMIKKIKSFLLRIGNSSPKFWRAISFLYLSFLFFTPRILKRDEKISIRNNPS